MSNTSVGTLLKSALGVSVAAVALVSLAATAGAAAGPQASEAQSISGDGASSLADGDGSSNRKKFRIRPSKGEQGGNGEIQIIKKLPPKGEAAPDQNIELPTKGERGQQQLVVPKGDGGGFADAGDAGGAVEVLDQPSRFVERPTEKRRFVESPVENFEPVALASPDADEGSSNGSEGSAFLDPDDSGSTPQTFVPGGSPLLINGIDISKIEGIEPGDKLVIRTEGDKTIITIIKAVKQKVHIAPTYSYPTYKYVYPRYKNYKPYGYYKYVKPYYYYGKHYKNYGYKNYGYKNYGYKNYGYKNYGYKNYGYKNYGYKNYGYKNYGYKKSSYGHAKKSYSKGY